MMAQLVVFILSVPLQYLLTLASQGKQYPKNGTVYLLEIQNIFVRKIHFGYFFFRVNTFESLFFGMVLVNTERLAPNIFIYFINFIFLKSPCDISIFNIFFYLCSNYIFIYLPILSIYIITNYIFIYLLITNSLLITNYLFIYLHIMSFFYLSISLLTIYLSIYTL